MPTDTVEPTESPPGESVEPTAEPTQSPGGNFTPEQLADTMRQAASTGNQQVLEALQGMQELLQQQAASRQEPTPQIEPNELAERLLTDPSKVMQEQMNEWARQNVAPIMLRDFEVARDERIEAQSAEIDEIFGEGWFNENVMPRLTGKEGNLAAYPINQQADPMVIRSAIAGILGNKHMDPEERVTMREAEAKAAKAKHERNVASPPNMMGPGRSGGQRSNVLTPEMKEALDKFRDVGVKGAGGKPITEADLKASMTRGNTLSDWQEAQ